MTKYLVIKSFTDLQDNNHKYGVGDIYPHSNTSVSSERIKELSTTNNKRNAIFIKEIKEEKAEVETPAESIAVVEDNSTETAPKKRGRKKKENAENTD